jgi:hypothetical protein
MIRAGVLSRMVRLRWLTVLLPLVIATCDPIYPLTIEVQNETGHTIVATTWSSDSPSKPIAAQVANPEAAFGRRINEGERRDIGMTPMSPGAFTVGVAAYRLDGALLFCRSYEAKPDEGGRKALVVRVTDGEIECPVTGGPS